MISEILINPPVATYKNEARLNDLRSINYIFGANGTGKTTISRVIAGAPGHEHCQLQWQGSPLERLVYNRDFVDRNFNQNGPLQGVFTLGENQVEAEREIARLQPEIEKIAGDIDSLQAQLNGNEEQHGKCQELKDLEPALTEKCWKQKQRHDSYFQEAFTGVRNNAERFKEKVLSEQASNTAELLPLDELKEKAKTVFSSNLQRVVPLGNLSADYLIDLEENELLQKVIVGNQDVDIAALINQLGNSDWVKQGLKYQQKDPATCPFCQQPTDKHFAESLEAFFSEAYDQDIQALRQLQIRYQGASKQLLAAIERNAQAGNPFLDIELFHSEAQTLEERLKANHEKLAKKIDEPSRKLYLEPIESMVSSLQQLIDKANEETSSHNQTVANIGAEKKALTAQVWRYVLNELSDDLQQYKNDKNRLTKTIKGMEENLNKKIERRHQLENQVKELEKKTTSVLPTVTAINDLLQKFGFHSFSIGTTDDERHYRIVRENGEDASRSLSEGEKTFVTFLYFYQLIKGAQSPEGVTTNRVVVFDDPISSLDSDILYIVSSLIKGVMDEVRNGGQIKQVFILTHNVYFHKEISYNFDRKKGTCLREESFWMIKKLQQGSVIERHESNPIQSAYELLWEDLKSQNLSSISMQNTLRRILENYFNVWGGMKKDEICDLFDGRDKLICQSLYSWVNDGSHSIHDDLYINHGEQTNKTYLRVFRAIFEKSGHIGHYNMMVGSQAPDVEENA